MFRSRLGLFKNGLRVAVARRAAANATTVVFGSNVPKKITLATHQKTRLFHSSTSMCSASEPMPANLANLSTAVLTDNEFSTLMGSELWKSFTKARQGEGKLNKEQRNAIAKVVRLWAQSKGVASYSHQFSPIRGPIHGEKIESFVSINFSTGEPLLNLSGTELFQSETDGSSFPNGGLRATHTAAAYMGWDLNSPPYIYDGVLYLSSAFVSWTGDALDLRTPLLRAEHALDKQAVRMLRHLGDKETKHVKTNVGWEQEFYLIDRDHFLARPDLMMTGRTLFGSLPLNGQELSDNYFAVMYPRARDLLSRVKDKLWELGVTITCVHNEVGPAQHEFSPIFTLSAQAADTNVLAMQVLRDFAQEQNLAVLFHEKPFAGINGNGKHNNWGMNCDSGANLFVAGKTASEQLRFAAFTAALARSVHLHGDLLRIGVATSGNDHRLGAQEAPPAIFTIHMGAHLEQFLRDASNGGPLTGYGDSDRFVSVSPSVPDIETGLEDRNRTAPFPWCGNRFEFRAVGGNQQIAWPIAMVNAAMADSLKHMCNAVDAGTSVEDVVRNTLRDHAGAFYHGDGYDSAKLEGIAREHNLFHLKTTPEAWEQLNSAKNVELFQSLGVFKAHELEARQNIMYEAFFTELEIEVKTLLKMTRGAIAPAVISDLKDREAYASSTAEFQKKKELCEALYKSIDALQLALDDVPADGSSEELANHALTRFKPALVEARTVCDALEDRLCETAWPYPTYTDMCYQHQ